MPAPLKVIFFETATGERPTYEWLRGLPADVRKVIGEDMRAAQNGWPVGMPRVRPLKGGLYELRSTAESGEYRLFFTASAGELVVLHGMQKKSAKTPQGDMDLARARQKALEAAK